MAEIQRLDRGNSFPPEKYYEACITYHILRYYEEKRIGRIFPFSISQIREKTEGYDFGYYLEDKEYFFIQYKRPYYGSSAWQINIGQLNTIVENGIGKITYYAFPDFHNIFEWYTGLENTFFFERSRSGYADSAEENEGIRNGSGKEEGMEIKEV